MMARFVWRYSLSLDLLLAGFLLPPPFASLLLPTNNTADG